MSDFINAHKIKSYYQPPAGNTEKYITLKPIKADEGLMSSYDCLKDYHIHEFGQGFKAAEYILQHIVTHKLNGTFELRNDLWHQTVAVRVECEIFAAENSQSFAELKPTCVEDIHPQFAATEGPDRLNDIYAYTDKRSRGEDLGYPLYVTGAVLNRVGANIDPNMVFMMDGARRIVAAALTHQPRITIYLLMLETEYAQLIKEAHLHGLADQIKQIQWFDNYQTIPLVGLQGQRSLKRFELMDMSILQGNTVMDFGCNLGQSCIKAIQAGASQVIGIEGMPDTYRVARQIGKTIGFSNLHYLNVDFNDVHFDEQIDEYYPQKIDYAFFLSVYRTRELTQRERLFNYIINKTTKGIFFEGHADSKIDTIDYYDWLFDCFKVKYKFLGHSEGNLRPLFFCPIESDSARPAVSSQKMDTTAREKSAAPAANDYLVSAIISTYESEKFIEGKIKDLLKQTIGEQLEIIIIDSHSPENEKAIVTQYAQKHQNIKYIRTEKRETIYQAWNRGIKAAHGKYITNANTDDRLRPDAFEILAEELNRNADIALAYGDFFITQCENQDFYNHVCCGYSIKPDYAPDIMLSGCHMGPQPMWRKRVHAEIGYFDEHLESAGDYEFWCRLAAHRPMKHINRFLGLYYHNPAGIVNSNQNKSNHETALVKEKYKDKFPPPSGKTPTGYYYKDRISSDRYVNICMVTYDRLDFTRQAIESIQKNTRFPHVITVVDNNSQDGTQKYLAEVKREGIIKNLILLDENRGVAKASNLAWQQEPNAAFYLKYDNDIVIQKQDWLLNLVEVADRMPELGAVGYNFEPTSYALERINGHNVRIKKDANIGGACYLIPKKTEKKFGYWCEDYGLYGEEDGDYSLRLRLAGYDNAYMEDENIGIHLPGGKAALIEAVSKRGINSQELEKEYEYRTWKDSRRQELQKPGGILQRNVAAYHDGIRSLYVPRGIFLGKLGSNIQVFEQNGSFLFLPVSKDMGDSEFEKVKQWLDENNITNCKNEKYYENGIEAFRTVPASSSVDLNIRSNHAAESLPLPAAAADEKNQSPANQIHTTTPAAPVRVSIIIPVYNQWQYTQNCLKALYGVTDIQGGFEVIVVDNASTDNTQPFLEKAQEKYPGLRFVRNQSNFGFAKACNQGAAHSKGYYLVFLNNDTLPQPGWLDEMIKTAEKDPLAGMVGSRLLYPDGTIQHAGVYLSENGIPYHAFRAAPGDHPAAVVTRETPGVTGACLLMPRQLYQQLGGFNEDYHMYVEDVDLCLRTWDAGFKVVYCAESVLTHFESASITDVNRRDAQVRAGWKRLLENWSNKWPAMLAALSPEDSSHRIDFTASHTQLGNDLNASKVLWHAPIFDPSGYADEARNFILQLQKQNIKPTVREIGRRSNVFRDGLDERVRTRLDQAIAQDIPQDFISVIQFPAYAFKPIDGAKYNIGRTTFETDSLPAEWVAKCNSMDEIWVPSEFNMQTFKAVGVTAKLFKAPEGVDVERFQPSLAPLELPGTRGTIFLSIFEWTYRKGWDVLLKSWAQAFGPHEDVCLVLRTYPINATDGENAKAQIEQRIDRFLETELKMSRTDVAPIIVLADQIHDRDMPRLYAAADAYVLPSRGEGWGRTQMEAMSCGLPVLSTCWSGNLEFMNDHNSLLIDHNGLAVIDERVEIPFYRGQKWAEPSAEHLSELMRQVVENPTEMQQIGRRARLDVERYWGWDKITRMVAKRLREIESERHHSLAKTNISAETFRLRWEGSQFVHHSLALVNRELCIELAQRPDLELSIIPYEPHEMGPDEDPERFGLIEERLHKPLSAAADFHVRHQWPPNFTPPPEGHWIMIQPWEFGALPLDWIEPMKSEVDEIWAYTDHVRNVYINSGIPDAKIHVIPLGINYDQFHPDTPKITLPTDKTFKFLFVGGTIMRKGIDVLLNAYTEAFTSEDDVCLVIKDMGGQSFYRGQTAAQIIEDIKKNPTSPEILYITEVLNNEDIAGLYTTCDCLVHPYRGEGFGLPVAEAMACGLPVIVTRGGACDDFCSDENAYFIDSARRPIQLNSYVLSAPGWLLEPNKAQLVEMLKWVCEHPEPAKEKGAIAANQIKTKVDWKMASELIMKRLKALKAKPISRFAAAALSETPSADLKSPEDIYDHIQASKDSKRAEEVINELEMLLDSHPQFALAYNDLGVLYYHCGNKEKAHMCYEKAAQLDPVNMVFQKNLADFYYVELGRVEDALQIYVNILKANPEDVETLLITGHICVSLHRFEDAKVFYRRVLELEPLNQAAQENLEKLNQIATETTPPELESAEQLYAQIQPLLNNGDPHKAISALEKLLESYPDYAAACNDLGVLYYHTGDKEKSQHHYERAVELMPENINFKKNLADFYCIERGWVEDALHIYVNILTTHPQDVETLLATGLICVALDKRDDARDFFNQVLQIEPWNEDARKQLEALERQPSGASLNVESPDDAYRRLQEKQGALTPAEALVELEKFIECYPDFAVGHNDLAVLYHNTGNKEKALQHYQQAADLQPDNITLQKNLADFLFIELKKVEEALEIYVNILAVDPNDVETLLITGHICVALRKFDDAKVFYEKVLALAPDNEDAGRNLNTLNNRPSGQLSATTDSINAVSASALKADSSDLNAEKAVNQHAQYKTSMSIIIRLDGIQNRIKECIKSIQAHTPAPYELLFVDRGATKGMLKWAQQLVKDNDHYHIIECNRQAGWAESLNQAIKTATGEIITLMHNDVTVSQGWLEAFKICINLEPNIGLVGPISNRAAGIQQMNDSDECDRVEFESAAAAFYERNRYRRVATLNLSDFCLAFRRDLPAKIGDFDEQFTSEEVIVKDFCNRVTAGGYQNLIAADTYIYHYDRHPVKNNASTKKSTRAEDWKTYQEKWNGAQSPEAKALQIVQLLANAAELSHKGQIDAAVETLLSGIGAQPDDKRLYIALAQILLSVKRFLDAKEALMEMPSADNNPDMRKTELLGYAEEGLENLEAAQTCVEQLLAMNPNHAHALNLKGVLAYRNADSHSAEKYFKAAIDADAGYGEPYTNLGMLQLEADQQEAALNSFEKSFRLTPTDLDIATNYHTLIAEIAGYGKAENVVREAAALYPNNQKIKYMLIDFLVQQGKYEMAMGEIEDAIIKFGTDDGILAAALKIREKLGPITIPKSSKKACVSLCMIIKDEETYLARCLASVKPIVDEMIVVDTGSVDRSKDIAITFGAQVYDYEWENDFAAARNFSISKASGEWIFILDGDEVISTLDYDHFNKIVSKAPRAPVAYSIFTRNYNNLANIVGWVPNDGKYPDEQAAIGWLPSEKVRLFYGKDQIWFEGAVHELVDPVLKKNGIHTKQCRIPVHHYGRLDNQKLERKGEIYFEIGEKKLAEMSDDMNAIRELAVQATILEKNEKAIELWQKLLAMNPYAKLASEAYVNMGTVYNRTGKFQEALLAAQKAVAHKPDLKEAQYNYAIAELHVGNAQTTINVLESLLSGFPDYPPAQFILSAAYCCENQTDIGLERIEKLKSTALGPHLKFPFMELAQSLISAGKIEYALQILSAAIESDIVPPELLALFKECLKMKDKAENSPDIPQMPPIDPQTIKFENLPQ